MTVSYAGTGCNLAGPLATALAYTVAPQPAPISYTLTPTSQHICQGGVVNLGVSSIGGAGTPTYTWTGPGITTLNTTSTPSVSYTTNTTGSGKYNVTLGYSGIGCISYGPLATALNYTVTPQPVITSYSLTPTSQYICQGGIANLGVVSSGGAGTPTYTWTGPGITTLNTTSAPAISYTTNTTGSGAYNVVVSYPGIGCNTSAPLSTALSYTVNAQPSVTSYTLTPTSQNICQGGTINLGVVSTGGAGAPTYTWTGPGITTGNTTSVPSIVYTSGPTGSGNYNVTLGYTGIGCSSASLATPLTYTVGLQPAVTSYTLTPSSQNICQGGIVNFGVISSGGSGAPTYTWTGPGITTLNTTAVPSVSYTTNTTGVGSYSVTLAYSGVGCNTTPPLVTLLAYTVAPQPSITSYTLTPSSTGICQGGTINLGVSSAGGIGAPSILHGPVRALRQVTLLPYHPSRMCPL